MKYIHYFFLIALVSLFSACTEELSEQEHVELSALDRATRYLNYVESPVLLGKATIDENGMWDKAWVITKDGAVKELEFSNFQQPTENNVLLAVQVEDLYRSGELLYTLDDKISLANNHNSAELKEKSLMMSEGVAYFSIHIDEKFRSCENGSCGASEPSDDKGPAEFLVSIIAMNDEVANTTASIQNKAWLQSIDNLLN